MTLETAESAAVLEAARAAMPTHALLPAAQELSARQRPLVPLLMALLDSAATTAQAIDDNAWDEAMPLSDSLADLVIGQCEQIRAAVANARCAHQVQGWSLPSMTRRELV